MASVSQSKPQPQNGLGLFGLDLAQWPAQWRAAWQALLALPGLRALAPEPRVRTHAHDGRSQDWRLRTTAQGTVAQAIAAAAAPDAQAVLLPPAAVLERTLALPRLSPEDLRHAVGLEVQSCTPFAPAQTVHGFAARPDGQVLRVRLAITSRAQCEAALRQAGLGADAEIWLQPDAAHGQPPARFEPLVLQGWGEAARQRRVRQGQNRRTALLALAAALALALLATPVLFKRQKALQAQAALAGLQRQLAQPLAAREALGAQLQRLQTLAQLQAQPLALPALLDMLTRTLPDGAWLSSLRAEGGKVTLNGMADDAAALVRLLAQQPGVTDVHLASPATRMGGEAKERFVIELRADMPTYGAFSPASTASTAPAASAPAASAPASAPASRPNSPT